MSWEQNYSIPSVETLLEKLTGKTGLELLKDELLLKQGVSIENVEEVLLDEGMYEAVRGMKIILSDGRVFIPKLTEKFSSDGNYGLDVYEYSLETETPKVMYIDEDTTREDKQDYIEATKDFPIIDDYSCNAENDGG